MTEKIKLLIGGSPCTYWSVAQNPLNRELTAEGLGWDLFHNFLVAKEKFKPDFFLYENNKSMAKAIKAQISQELECDPYTLNSSLVSAQKRERFYWTNVENIPIPADRGIVLDDILYPNLPFGNTLDDKAYCLTASYGGAVPFNTIERHQRTMVMKPIRVGIFPNQKGELKDSQGYRVYSTEGKSITICANGGGLGAKTGLYAIRTEDGTKNCYLVYNKKITIREKEYDLNVPDGFYEIRKLTPNECELLQTLPLGFTDGISDSQRYRCLGNGWTAEIIIHLLGEMLKDVPRDMPIDVLSMYDGISTGLYCLLQLGFTNIVYNSYEIDKYAIKVSNNNFPHIIQRGNAFNILEDDWEFLYNDIVDKDEKI